MRTQSTISSSLDLKRALVVAMLVWMALVPVMDVQPSAQAQDQPEARDYRLVGYYPSYSIYEDYFVTDITGDQLTHINYAWGAISENGQCISSDLWTDTQYSYPDDTPDLRLRGNIRQLQLLRGENPNLKILFTVGGWDYSERFSEVAATPASRERFARSCVALLRQYLFDGIDIDWRYPVSGGPVEGSPEDREHFTLLMAELRAQLDEAGQRDGKPYLLTMLMPTTTVLYNNIEIDRIHVYVDWVNLMTFGFQGAWSTVASHHAPLFGNTRDPRGEVVQSQYNVDAVVRRMLDEGIPAAKLVVGIPFYAQTWRNVRQGDYFGLYQETDAVPDGTRPGGILYYRDMLPLLRNTGYIQFFDEETGVPWLYSPDERIAVSYENARSIRNKVSYVQSQQLGGVMVWQLNYDDAANSLLNVVYTALQ